MTDELLKTYGGYALGVIAALSWAWERFSKTRTNVSGDNLRRSADRSAQEALERNGARISELESLVETLRKSLIENMLKASDEKQAKQLAVAEAIKYREKYRHLYKQLPNKTKSQKVVADVYKPTDFSPLE